MIILEGPDGSGKTTLAKAICKEYDLDYRRPPLELLSSATGPSPELPGWWRAQFLLPPAAKYDGVYDRCFYISEAIYQLATVDRQLLIPGRDLAKGIMDLWAEDPVVIFCMPSMDTQLSNVIQDGRESLKGLENRHLVKINFMYWAYYGMYSNSLFENVTHYSYEKHTPEDIYEWLDGKGYERGSH